MIKAILFDIDGVVLSAQNKRFSLRLSEDYEVPMELITPFFEREFQFCLAGSADLREEVLKYIDAWNWPGSVDDLLDYWFIGETLIDKKIVNFIEEISGKGVEVYLASNQEKYRANFLLEDMELGRLFEESFFSCDLGHKKSDPEFFEKTLAILGLKPGEVMFWDDDEKNVKVAKKLGIDAHLYKNFDQFSDTINTSL